MVYGIKSFVTLGGGCVSSVKSYLLPGVFPQKWHIGNSRVDSRILSKMLQFYVYPFLRIILTQRTKSSSLIQSVLLNRILGRNQTKTKKKSQPCLLSVMCFFFSLSKKLVLCLIYEKNMPKCHLTRNLHTYNSSPASIHKVTLIRSNST